jgi:protoporphyrin/coproporphyrin ferrochelatase
LFVAGTAEPDRTRPAADRLAVVLFNLGGPDSPAAVGPFLFNLFSDPAIIRLPDWLRRPIAKLIALRRAPIARKIYAHLGGGSPLLANTQAQAAALEQALDDSAGEVRVFIAMRYWHPFSDETAAAVREFSPDRILLLPLYPQYSSTTTASSAAEWDRAAEAAGLKIPTQLICCYPTEPGFIDALVELAGEALDEARQLAGDAKPILIFSAHGLPEKIVLAGDPYARQVMATAQALVSRLDLKLGDPIAGTLGDWELGFQSRVGPVRWIGPWTDELIVQAAEENRAIVILPIAFVSEHSETLVELDIEYRKLAEKFGARAYVRAPTVSVHPAFIAGLARISRATLSDSRWLVPFGSCGPDSKICPCRITSGAAPIVSET